MNEIEKKTPKLKCGICERKHYARGLCRRCYGRVLARTHTDDTHDIASAVAAAIAAEGTSVERRK